MAKIKIEATEQEYDEIIKRAKANCYDVLHLFRAPPDVAIREEQIQNLFERIEPPRWRAKENERYLALNGVGKVIHLREMRSEADDEFWSAGNYYRTEEQALAAAERVKAAYRGDNA